jgi:membrane protein implicated in regulation of membrane protease activity
MTVIQIIYGTAPYCLWLCVAGAALAAALASGSRLPMAAAVAAVATALVSVAAEGFGPVVETALFLALSAALVGVMLRRPDGASEERAPREVPAAERPTSPARLVGRIARSSGAFANGVGRVWIDGMEWAAELDGEDVLPTGRPVRVTKVIGGVRLQVHPLAA